MVLKEAQLSGAIFNCPLFVVGGVACDPGTGADCLLSGGTVQTMNIPCDLASYSTYIGGFPNRITKVIQQLDREVVNGLDKINNQTRAIVNNKLLTPIKDVANGVTCGFFGTFYREVIESFCYQGIYGFRVIGWSYVSTGILTIVFIALMFAVWRRLIDNYDKWEEFEDGEGGNAGTEAQEI